MNKRKPTPRSFQIYFLLALLVSVLLAPVALAGAQDKKKKDDKKGKEEDDKPKEQFVVKKLTQGMGLYQLGSVSPDRKFLSLIAQKEGGMPNLYVMDLSDFTLRPPLTKMAWGAADPAWSPDSTMLAFAGYNERGSFSDIYTVEVSTGRVRQVTANEYTDKEPAFTPDGKRLLFTTDESPLENAAFGIIHVGALPVTGGRKSEYFTEDEASTMRPQMTLDGKGVYVTKVSDQSGRHVLWEYDLKGKPVRDVTEEKFARIHKLILNPTNGTAVLWAQEQPEQQEQIYILDLKTGKVSDLPDPDLPKRSPALSPNGMRIAFVGPSESGNHLYLYDSTTGLIQRLTSKGTNIHSPVFITDDQIAFGGEREGKKADVPVQTVGNTTYMREATPDREIYLVTLSQKVEEEKKKK